MALSSLDTNNYEHSADNTTDLISSISVDDIDTQSPLQVGYEYTIKNVFSGLNKIIKAIIDKFKKVDEDMQGVHGSFALPEHMNSKESWNERGTYKITGLKRTYTRGYFAFFDSDGTNVFGSPSLWIDSMGNVTFYDQTLSSGNPRYFSDPYFRGNRIHATSNSYTYLSKFEVSQTDDTMTINLQIGGNNCAFSGYELRYYLF